MRKLRPSKTSYTAIAIAMGLVSAACGARSQLIEPDVGGFDVADVRDAFDANDAVDAIDVRDARETFDVPPSPTPPIDTSCPGVCPYRNLTPDFPPFRPLLPRDVPLDCTNGFELGGANGGCGNSTYVLTSHRAGGARAITLDMDFATYRAPDGVTITAIDASGATYTLLQSCRLQTSENSGPSTERPSFDTIRQFRLAVREGTREISFDFGAVTTPMYIEVLGLCDFDVTRYSHAAFWRAIP